MRPGLADDQGERDRAAGLIDAQVIETAHADQDIAYQLATFYALDGQNERALEWLERAIASCLQPLQSFAKGLREDYAAVKAGVTLSWSTGPVEGQINNLKMLKRQMYGRAHIALLRQRVLLPT